MSWMCRAAVHGTGFGFLQHPSSCSQAVLHVNQLDLTLYLGLCVCHACVCHAAHFSCLSAPAPTHLPTFTSHLITQHR